MVDNGALSARCAAATVGTPSASRCGLRECDAAAGAALACLSAPARLGGTPRGGIAALHADVAPYPRLHFCAPAMSALVGGGAAAFEPLRPRDVAAAALAPAASLASADAAAPGAATLAAALFWRAAGDDATDVAAAAAAARASAAAPRPADYAAAGPAVYLTPVPMPSYPVRVGLMLAAQHQSTCWLLALTLHAVCVRRALRLRLCHAALPRW